MLKVNKRTAAEIFKALSRVLNSTIVSGCTLKKQPIRCRTRKRKTVKAYIFARRLKIDIQATAKGKASPIKRQAKKGKKPAAGKKIEK